MAVAGNCCEGKEEKGREGSRKEENGRAKDRGLADSVTNIPGLSGYPAEVKSICSVDHVDQVNDAIRQGFVG